MLTLLEDAVEKGILSPPHIPYLPTGFPVALAIVAVRLMEGCDPPTGARARVGTGTGPNVDSAVSKAMFEAAERYSLQYNPARPMVRIPVEVLNGAPDPLPQSELCLGAPNGSVSSIGCAAGVSLEDASDRAAFEILEHHQLARLRSGEVVGIPFDPATIPNIAATAAYLDMRLRQVRALAVKSPEGYSVVWALTCDPDGGRPTEGSAASVSVDAAATKAVEEAIFSWRNMIELERNGVIPTEGTTDLNFRVYRGAEKVFRSMPDLVPGTEPSRHFHGSARPVEIVAASLSTRVRIFDMTEPSLGVPVVRVVSS